MSYPKDLLERKCLSEYHETLHGYARVKEIAELLLHLLFFGPKAVALGAEMVRVLTDLKIHVLTFESVEKYKQALVEKFFSGAQTINVYEEYTRPQVQESLSLIEEAICDYFPEPLKTIRKFLPKAKFFIETLEVFGTQIGSLLVIGQGDKKYYLHVFEGEPMVQRMVDRASAHLAPSF